MRRMLTLAVGLLLSLMVAACGSAAPSSTATTAPQGVGGQKILVAYFSRSGNTKQLAEIIQQRTGGDIFAIMPQEPYSPNYNETVERFKAERAANARPAINGRVENMDSYNVVFVGYPNWGSDMPHVVRTFLEQYSFAGKTVVPFCTSGGGGFAGSLQTLRTEVPNATLAEGFHASGRSAGSSSAEVGRWLQRIGVVQ